VLLYRQKVDTANVWSDFFPKKRFVRSDFFPYLCKKFS
jgi:hypothetical protein